MPERIEAADATPTDAAEPDTGWRDTRPSAGHPTADQVSLRFDLLRSAIYHDMRAAFFGRANRLMLFMTLLLGSSTMAAVATAMPFAGFLTSALVTIVTAALLVFDFGGEAKTHQDLKRRFYELLAALEEGTDPQSITSKQTLLYADEGPIFRAVDAIAHNTAGRLVYGDTFDTAVIVSRWQRMTRNFSVHATAEFPDRPCS